MEDNYSLQELIPFYRELNVVYKNIVERQQLVFTDQKHITNFYRHNNDKLLFEQMVIESLQQIDKGIFWKATTVLKELITENISYYNTHNRFLLKLDIIKVCQGEEKKYDSILERQLKSIRYYSDQLKELDGSYESASWNNDIEKMSTVEQRIEKLKPLYEKEKKGLDELYTRKNALQKEMANFSANFFEDIFSLGKSYIDILNSYLQKEDPAIANDNTGRPASKQKDNIIYFDMGLIAKVHAMCNNNQFANVDEIGFFNFFNLRDNHSVKIKDQERVRVYYLLHKLSEILEKETKKVWLECILMNLQIPRNDYNSKYRHCVSDMPGMKNAKFAKNLDVLFDTL
ncbi:MAG: hypothetical protein M3Z26_08135 [Bacteroidota bacterium]|nr:hypothetical protein [Bacteroidota bacterium]